MKYYTFKTVILLILTRKHTIQDSDTFYALYAYHAIIQEML